MQLITVVVIAILIYMIQYNMYRKNWENGLSVRLSFDDEHIRVGEKSRLIEVVNNAKLLPLPVFHVKLSLSKNLELTDRENVILSDAYHRNDVFSVMGNQKVTRTVEFTAKRRGMYGINGVNITARDFFMTKSFARKIKNDARIYVLPAKVDSPSADAWMNRTLGELAVKNSLHEDMLAADGIRRCERSDSIRRINWRATARCDELMVNTYQRMAELKVRIMLDLGDAYASEPEEIVEYCISLVSTISERFIADGIPVAFASNGIDIVTGASEEVPYGSSEAHCVTIDKCLSRIGKSGGVEVIDEIFRRSLLDEGENMTYIVISTRCRQEIISELDGMTEQGRNVHMMVPCRSLKDIKPERKYIHGVEVDGYDA